MEVQKLVRAHDPITSVMAAEGAVKFSGTHCDLIMDALKDNELTPAEISEATGLTVVQVCRRLPELQRAGKAQLAFRDGGVVIRNGYRVWEAV